MAWRCSGKSNVELIDNLFKNGLITSARVRDAMMKVFFPISFPSPLWIDWEDVDFGKHQVDRAHYCPSPSYAYEDSPQSIGHAATISAPHMHATACESLLSFLTPGSRVLDIGSGSGYLTAVLAELVQDGGKRGRVVGLEHIKALKELGEGNVGKSERGREMLRGGLVKFVVGDGRKGWREDGEEEGWDAIHVGAAAVELHEELIDQLRSPGR